MQAKILMPKLQVPGADQSQITVLEFSGKQAISELYRFEIEFVSKSSIEGKQVVNQKAQLSFAKKGSGTTPLNGEVISFTEMDDLDEYHRYKICIMPKVHRLQHTRKTEVFLDKTIPQVIKQILNNNGINQVELDVMGDHKPKEFIFKYNEPDWDFITRWMEFEGLFYYFSQSKSEEKLVITDNNSTLKNNQDINEIYYQSYTMASEKSATAHLVYNYQLTTHAMPQKVIVKSYYHEQSSKPYTSQVMIDPQGSGDVVFWAENIKNNKENQQLAKYISESYKCKKEILSGVSSGSLILPGTIINHKKFKKNALNVPMLITESIYSGSQKRAFASLHSAEHHTSEDYFKCEYKAIDKSTPYRRPVLDRVPRIAGMLPGFVDHEGDDNTVQINKKGFYKFRLAISEDKPGKGSGWVRKLESYIGDQYAFQLPLRKGDEVLIGFQFGNPDLPVVLGSLSNSTHRHTITSQNQNYMGVYTKEKNMFFINEQDGKTRGMQFSTPNKQTTLSLGTDNVFKSTLDAGYLLSTESSAYQDIGKHSINKISHHRYMGVGGNDISTVKGMASTSVHGQAYYSYMGARSVSVVGLDFVSRLGAMIDTTTGFQVKLTSGWRYEQDSSTSLKTAPVLMYEAEASLSLKVGASSITLTPEGIVIDAPTLELVAPFTTISTTIFNVGSAITSISGIVGAGDEVELGPGIADEAKATSAEAEVQATVETAATTAAATGLKATAIAAWGAAKEGFTAISESFSEIGSAFEAQFSELDEAIITPLLSKVDQGVSPVATKAGGVIANADKLHVLGQGDDAPNKIVKEVDDD